MNVQLGNCAVMIMSCEIEVYTIMYIAYSRLQSKIQYIL